MSQFTSFRSRYVIPFERKTANSLLEVNKGIFADSGSNIDLTLPNLSGEGDVIQVINVAGGFTIKQNPSQQIITTGGSTTTGTGGSVSSNAVGNSITIVCETDNLIWHVMDFNGTLTFT